MTLESETDVSHYLDELYSDPKFRHWGIERNLLEERFSKRSGSLGFGDILQIILDLCFGDEKIRIAVFKQGEYIFQVDFLRKVFPRCISEAWALPFPRPTGM